MLAPRLTISVDLPPAPDAALDLSSLPPRPGVFLFEDTDGRAIVIGMTANLRRQVRTRLAPPTDDGPSRRVDYRAITRGVRGMTVGSAFEADWAYLALARRRLPHTCRSLFDRWCGWFVRCNLDAPFPRLRKMGTTETNAKGTLIGPFADKHDAQRAIDALESGFDLCRYHHILVEAPHATACAYKEMGKCPAPCDGSITMDTYRDMMRDAVDLAGASGPRRDALEREMQAASADLDFETAGRLRQRLKTLAVFDRPAFTYVDRLERFRFVAVLPAESADRVRVMTIVGGRVEPWADLPLDLTGAEMGDVLDELDTQMAGQSVDVSPEGIETIGLICWHLFRPVKARGRADLIPAREGIDRRLFQRVIGRMRKRGGDDPATEPEVDEETLGS